MSSTFEVPVVSVKLERHPNADTLSIVHVFGWQVVVKTDEWKDGDLGAYIRPDSVVPYGPEWAFLGTEPRHRRIRTRKFRGEWSHGLLIKAPAGASDGSNVAAQLGITNYEPPEVRGPSYTKPKTLWQRLVGIVREHGVRPRGNYPYYDVEHLRRYLDLLRPDEQVFITEKIHGANALYTWRKPWLGRGKVFVRSRTLWKWRFETNWWTQALANTPQLQEFLKDHPGCTVYGEVYGAGVQELPYGKPHPHFVAFDVWDVDRFWWTQADAHIAFETYGIPPVPVLHDGANPGIEAIQEMALRDSTLARGAHMSEGVVVASLERRVILKVVSDRYLEKAK